MRFYVCKAKQKFLWLRTLWFDTEYLYGRPVVVVRKHVSKNGLANICFRWRLIRKWNL